MARKKCRYLPSSNPPWSNQRLNTVIQIWFQNRRQTSRRKSRPLLPHEIALYSTNPGMTYDVPTFWEPRVASSKAAPPLADAALAQTLPRPSSSSSGSLPEQQESSSDDAQSSLDSAGSDQQRALEAVHDPTTHPVRSIPICKSAPSLRDQYLGSGSTEISSGVTRGAIERPLRKASSFVRLALSSEGSAKVTTKDTSSPSPPRPSQDSLPSVGSIGLQQSATSTPKLTGDTPLLQVLQRSSSGHSRDSRAWEFWCDKDARTELEDKAGKDASGSAVGAIDHLRHASGRKILGALSAKRDPSWSQYSSASKRTKLHMKPTTLRRANTSLGRLQHQSALSGRGPSTLKHSATSSAVYIPGNDSDKENWSPDGSRGFSTKSATDEMPKVSLMQSHNMNDENQDPEADPELAAFMRGGGKDGKISQAEELDCVQGLLSLSQGNWR